MARGSMSLSIANYAKVCADLKAMNKDAEKAISRTISDFKRRAPAWVSAAVSEEYTIKKSEVKAAMTGAKKIGSVKVSGIEVDNIGLEYRGRLLTPLHFKMNPKKSPAKLEKKSRLIPGKNIGSASDVVAVHPVKAYQISMEVHKGKTKALAGDAFLGSNKGSAFIPFQRAGDGRKPIYPIKTVSVPQMITNEKVAETIQKNIEEGLRKRLEHHAQQAMNG